MTGVHRRLLTFGIGAVAIAVFGSLLLGLSGMEPFRSFRMFGYSHNFQTSPREGMGPGMMGGRSVDPNEASAPPAFEDADEILVTMDDFRFDPVDIGVHTGTVNLTLVNEGAAAHDFSVPELSIRIFAAPGETVTSGVDFIAPGTYDTLCSIPGHASLGMTGSLVVSPRT